MDEHWTRDREWRKKVEDDQYIISTELELLDHEFINKAFGTEDMYWAKPIPPDQLAAMLSKSTTLGLYKIIPAVPVPKTDDEPSSPRTPSPTIEDEPGEKCQQIGLARFMSDYITMAYLTDVYILPEYRALGLGRWLIDCCKAFMDGIPAMRRALLMATPGAGMKFYESALDFYDIREEREHAVCMTKRFFKMGDP